MTSSKESEAWLERKAAKQSLKCKVWVRIKPPTPAAKGGKTVNAK